LPCIRRIFGSPGTEREVSAFDSVTKQTTIKSRYFLKIHSLQTTYASEEDREMMEKTLKEHSLHVDDKKRLRSSRLRKQLSRVIEEAFQKQTAMLSGSEPDLIKSEKTPNTTIPRYHSENDKENRNSSESIASSRRKNVHYDSPLTPVGAELDVHTHNHVCPETQERSVPKGHLHVDVEPYPYSNA
jgi:hypothetical protein